MSRTLTSRCDLSQNLQKRGCDVRFIESPSSTTTIEISKPLSSKSSGQTQFDVVQIEPQRISLNLRPGMRSLSLQCLSYNYDSCHMFQLVFSFFVLYALENKNFIVCQDVQKAKCDFYQ